MKNPGFAGAVAGAGLAALILMACGVDIDPARAGNGVTIAFVIAIMAGGCCGLALRRGLRGSMAGFWHSVPGRWLIGRIAGTAVILLLLGPVWKLVTLAMAYAIAGAVYAFGIAAVAQAAPAIMPIAYALTALAVWRLRTPAKIIIGKGSRPLRRWYRSFAMGGGGSSGFASIAEIWANRWKPGMIFLGHSIEDRHWPVGVDDDRMMVLLAGTGGGKNLTSIIPNMLGYEGGSMFCMDVKRQNADVTAAARRAMGQDVYILDPFGAETAHLNPLDGCDPQAPDYFEQIMGIVDDLVIPGDGKNQVWTEWSRIVIGGLTDYELRRNDGEFVPPEEEYGNEQ